MLLTPSDLKSKPWTLRAKTCSIPFSSHMNRERKKDPNTKSPHLNLTRVLKHVIIFRYYVTVLHVFLTLFLATVCCYFHKITLQAQKTLKITYF